MQFTESAMVVRGRGGESACERRRWSFVLRSEQMGWEFGNSSLEGRSMSCVERIERERHGAEEWCEEEHVVVGEIAVALRWEILVVVAAVGATAMGGASIVGHDGGLLEQRSFLRVC